MKQCLFFALFFCVAVAKAQHPLPLQHGNIWQYRSTDPFDPHFPTMIVTGDTVHIAEED